jgi:hypothetical protein
MTRLRLYEKTPIAQRRARRITTEGRHARSLAEKTTENIAAPIQIPRGSTDPLWLAQLKQRLKSSSTP